MATNGYDKPNDRQTTDATDTGVPYRHLPVSCRTRQGDPTFDKTNVAVVSQRPLRSPEVEARRDELEALWEAICDPDIEETTEVLRLFSLLLDLLGP